jgi:hypothetical protein
VTVTDDLAETRRHAALDCQRAQSTEGDLVALHTPTDRYERSNAAEGADDATHAEVFRVVPASDLHVILARRR